jgi:Zn-dependent protease with chaperone function
LLPDLTVLVALLVGLMSLEGRSPDPLYSLAGTLLCVIVGGALSRMALVRGLRALEADEPLVAEVSTRWTVLWAFLAWMACIFLFDWGAWVAGEVPRLWWLGRVLILYLPALLSFGVGWVARARLEAAIVSRRGGVPLRTDPFAAVFRALRRNSIVILPLLVLDGISEGIWVLGELDVGPMRRIAMWQDAMPLFSVGLMMAIVVLALPVIPRLFVRALRAEPLEDGRLRTVLQRGADSIGLHYRDIMLWRTGGRVFNAMVVGFTPGTRLIFLSDGLVKALTEEETVAVFFHEAGHAKRWHLPLFLVMFFSISLLFYAASPAFSAWGFSPFMQVLLQLAVYWFVLLGWVSRRFERESDVYGARHAGLLSPDAPPLDVPGLPRPLPHGAALMMRALKRIRTIVGTSFSHRHGAIEDRVSYVAAHATDPDVRASFVRSRRSLLAGIGALVAAAVAATAWRLPIEFAQAEAHVAYMDGYEAYRSAWTLEREGNDGSRVSAAWAEAYAHFDTAARRLAPMDDEQARRRRIRYRFQAAETALHGMRDTARAETDFRRTLDLLDTPGAAGPDVSTVRFETHVALGRLTAWRHGAGEEGEAGEAIAEAERHLAAARSTDTERHVTGIDPEAAELARERLRLLVATIDGARGEVELARSSLRKLAQLDRGAKTWEHHAWMELADDARRELERLEGR